MPEANLRQETRSWLAWGEPRTSSAFPTRPRASWAMLRKVPNSADQLCEVDRPTNSPTTNSLSRNEASLRGRANDQVLAKQVCSVGQTTKPTPCESMRWGERPSLRQADPQGRNLGQHYRPMEAATRHNVTKPWPGRTYGAKRRQTDTMEHPRVHP